MMNTVRARIKTIEAGCKSLPQEARNTTLKIAQHLVLEGNTKFNIFLGKYADYYEFKWQQLYCIVEDHAITVIFSKNVSEIIYKKFGILEYNLAVGFIVSCLQLEFHSQLIH